MIWRLALQVRVGAGVRLSACQADQGAPSRLELDVSIVTGETDVAPCATDRVPPPQPYLPAP